MIEIWTFSTQYKRLPKQRPASSRAKLFNLSALCSVFSLFAFAMPALAATQGTLGTSSTGTAEVSVTIPEQFRVSNLQDVSFGTWGGGDLTNNQNTCVYHNGDGSYSITATSSTGSFALQNGPDSLPFEVYFNNTPTPAGGSALAYNSTTSTSGSNTTAADCSAGGLSANIRVRIAEGDLQAANPGAYNATLSFIIQAD